MSKTEISLEDGILLVKTAREIVRTYLKEGKRINLGDKIRSLFDFNSGVFVTINKSEQLRGCIGYPLPSRKLYQALVDSSIAAATEDPRFPPVDSSELDKITFEVTVLSRPLKIEVKEAKEYLSEIKIGRDGLIVKNGFNSGLLLPQVPLEYGWNVREFLENTCLKAGLPKDCWKDPETIIEKFEGIIFSEKSPEGTIVRE